MLEAFGVMLLIEFCKWSDRDPIGLAKVLGIILAVPVGIGALIFISLIDKDAILWVIFAPMIALAAWTFFHVLLAYGRLFLMIATPVIRWLRARYGFDDQGPDDVMYLK